MAQLRVNSHYGRFTAVDNMEFQWKYRQIKPVSAKFISILMIYFWRQVWRYVSAGLVIIWRVHLRVCKCMYISCASYTVCEYIPRWNVVFVLYSISSPVRHTGSVTNTSASLVSFILIDWCLSCFFSAKILHCVDGIFLWNISLKHFKHIFIFCGLKNYLQS